MAAFVITIDGPAASGKSTVARLLAKKLGATFLDTGAMYRAVTLAAMQTGIDMSDEDKLLDVLEASEFKFVSDKCIMTVCINGLDVTEKIRDPQVTANARYIASTARVREKLVQMQRKFAAGRGKIVTEGRDQGTVVFPDADVKFYLTAKLTERAKRRAAELKAKGEIIDVGRIQSDIEARDKSDQDRAIGPLKPADDGIMVDTTGLSIEEVVEKLLNCIKENV